MLYMINSSSEKVLVVNMIPPMELHLMMGVVSHLIKFLKEKWPQLAQWLLEMTIVAQPYHGGQLEGPECRKILKIFTCMQ